jgi:hypothetical protein
MKLSQISAETGVFTLRMLAMLAGGQGQSAAAKYINQVADGLEAGANVDAHMAEVAALLKAGTTIDWDDVIARAKAASERLQS